jgi:recombination protein RecA
MAAYANGIVVARELLAQPRDSALDGWGLEALAGRFVEVSGGAGTAALTVSAGLVLEAQRRGEFTAWIAGRGSIFYPPDFAAAGIDLEALPVIRAGDVPQALRAADTLLRSGGFALVVMDLGSKARLPLPMQMRLAGLAKKHRAVLLVLTRTSRRDPPAAAGGSLVSLRAQTEKKRADHDCFLAELRVVKDKQRVPGWGHAEMCRGSDGLC